MPGKTKENLEKASVLKGQEAEDRILAYLKKMNRPYGAVDVCANLKGAVPKTATQKILVALAEKGDVTQKTYGKSTFFVANQSNLDEVPKDKLSSLEEDQKSLEEENKGLAAEVKTASSELAKVKSTPTDDELADQIAETKASIQKTLEYLKPLRAGTPLISAEEIAQLDKDWSNWRAEWVSRRKAFMCLWHLVTDSLPPQDARDLAEDLGIEYDSGEHESVERGPLCMPPAKRR